MGKDKKAVAVKLFFGNYLTGFGRRERVEASGDRHLVGERD